MANIGETAELMNAKKLELREGSDSYIKIQDLFIHIGRMEDRNATTDGNVHYTVGKGDNYFTATMLATSPEISTFNTRTQTDTDGDLTSTSWTIVGTDRSGNTKTFAATGYLLYFDTYRDAVGAVKTNIFVRITGDTVTIT